MKKIRYLHIQFSSDLKRYELPAFRAAISDKAGKGHVLFHNHDENGFRHKYPLIQYKSIAGKPAIVCIEEAVDEIRYFFEKPDWSIFIGNDKREMKIERLNLNQFTMQVWDKTFKYSIINWLALNSENYKIYQELTRISEKINFLEQKLTGNILSFAKGINWTVDKQLKTKITKSSDTKILTHKGVKLMAFNMEFETNVFLPNFLGLGKGAGFGFGTVKQLSKEQK